MLVHVDHGETSVLIELSWSSRHLGGQQMALAPLLLLTRDIPADNTIQQAFSVTITH